MRKLTTKLFAKYFTFLFCIVENLSTFALVMEDKIFKQDAKSIVDLCFDKKLFKDEVTRDVMNSFEDLISYMLKSRFESYQRCEKLINSVKELEP